MKEYETLVKEYEPVIKRYEVVIKEYEAVISGKRHRDERGTWTYVIKRRAKGKSKRLNLFGI